MVKLRSWQQECLQSFVEARQRNESVFVFEACPGAGKSLMASELSWQMLQEENRVELNGKTVDSWPRIDFVLVIVPWKSIQGDIGSGMVQTFDRRGLVVRERFFIRGARVVEQPVPSNLDAVITTYAEVMNQETVDVLEKWRAKGFRFAVVFDEMHHANEQNGAWGEYAEEVQRMASVTVVMSGTFFRTDGRPIKFVTYKDGIAVPDFKYTYSSGVSDQVVRPVAFKFTDVELNCMNEDGIETHDLFSTAPNDRRIGKIMREVFDPEGECVRRMILDVNDSLTVARAKFPRAAALFTCRPGRNDSSGDKHVHQIAQKIRQYVGKEVVVVTHKDKNATGKIAQFRNGTSEYLVAVNMISEGVDIPRIRHVALMRYITSEMMFRQIVGRALRWIVGEDDGTAAKIFLPKFQRMYEFSMNMENEVLEGLRDLVCDKCGEWPCICDPVVVDNWCDVCHNWRCICERDDRQPLFEVIGQTVQAGGGALSNHDVAETHIRLAEKIISECVQHTGANDVQMGHMIQQAAMLAQEGLAEPQSGPTNLERLSIVRNRVNRLMNKLAWKKYGGDYKECWNAEFCSQHKISWVEARQTWGLSKLERVANDLEERLEKSYRG